MNVVPESKIVVLDPSVTAVSPTKAPDKPTIQKLRTDRLDQLGLPSLLNCHLRACRMAKFVYTAI